MREKTFDEKLSEALETSPFDPNSDPQDNKNRFRLTGLPKPGSLVTIDTTKFQNEPRIVSIDARGNTPVAFIHEPWSDPGGRRVPGLMYVYEGPEGVWSGFSVADREMVVGRLPISGDELDDLDDVYFFHTKGIKTGKSVPGIPE